MKRSKMPRMFTLLLCALLLFFMHTTTVLAADSKAEMTLGTPIHTWSATDYNFKDSFPLDIQPVIDESTVEYIAVPVGPKEPVTVNLEKLKVGLRIALKDGAEFESYEFYLYDAAADKILVHDVFDADEAVVIDEIARNTHHKFFVRLKKAEKSVTYSAGCACGVDPGNEVFFSMNFMHVNVPPLNSAPDEPTSSQEPDVPDSSDTSSKPVDSDKPATPAEPVPSVYDWVWVPVVCALLLAMLYISLRKRR